jgi:hypothetical protein
MRLLNAISGLPFRNDLRRARANVRPLASTRAGIVMRLAGGNVQREGGGNSITACMRVPPRNGRSLEARQVGGLL